MVLVSEYLQDVHCTLVLGARFCPSCLPVLLLVGCSHARRGAHSSNRTVRHGTWYSVRMKVSDNVRIVLSTHTSTGTSTWYDVIRKGKQQDGRTAEKSSQLLP